MNIGNSFGTIATLVRAYPKSALIVAGFLVAAGFSEGIGIGSILPLLKLILSGRQLSGDNLFGRIIQTIFGFTGIQPTVGVLLVFIAVLIGLFATNGNFQFNKDEKRRISSAACFLIEQRSDLLASDKILFASGGTPG